MSNILYSLFFISFYTLSLSCISFSFLLCFLLLLYLPSASFADVLITFLLHWLYSCNIADYDPSIMSSVIVLLCSYDSALIILTWFIIIYYWNLLVVSQLLIRIVTCDNLLSIYYQLSMINYYYKLQQAGMGVETDEDVSASIPAVIQEIN